MTSPNTCPGKEYLQQRAQVDPMIFILGG